MNGFILAAGLGTRMQELTADLPKPMLPYKGRPLLEYSLDLMRDWGINDITVNTHYKPDIIQEFLQNWSYANKGIHINVSRETDILGTAGGIRSGMHLYRDPGKPIVVLNPDSHLAASAEDHPSELIKALDSRIWKSLLALKELPSGMNESWFTFENENEQPGILKMVPKSDQRLPSAGQKAYYYIGCAILHPDSLLGLKTGERAELGPLWKLQSEENTLHGFLFKGDMTDLGTKEAYLQARLQGL